MQAPARPHTHSTPPSHWWYSPPTTSPQTLLPAYPLHVHAPTFGRKYTSLCPTKSHQKGLPYAINCCILLSNFFLLFFCISFCFSWVFFRVRLLMLHLVLCFFSGTLSHMLSCPRQLDPASGFRTNLADIFIVVLGELFFKNKT